VIFNTKGLTRKKMLLVKVKEVRIILNLHEIKKRDLITNQKIKANSCQQKDTSYFARLRH
jgi:hypothetical protein